MFDKFLFGNKQIPEMYFGNIPVVQIYFGNTLIWEKIAKRLVAGDKNVAIEYTPAVNIIISGIEIFTSQDSSNTNGRVKIIHESGLYVGSVNGDAKDGSTELYGLTGWKRYVNNAGIQLYAGRKYYIVFNDNQSASYYPAYFQNRTGNYKEYSNNYNQVTLTNLSTFGDYIGIFTGDDIKSFFSAKENDFANYDGDNGGTGYQAFTTNYIHIRSSNYASQTLKAQLGSGLEISMSELDAILKYNTGDLFIWWGNNYNENNATVIQNNYIHSRKSTIPTNKYKGIISQTSELANVDVDDYFLWTGTVTYLTQNKLYKKLQDVQVDGSFNFNNYSGDAQTVGLIQASYVDGIDNNTIDGIGNYCYSDRTGTLFTLKAGLILELNGGNGYSSSTWTDTPRVANTIVYLNEGTSYTINGNSKHMNAGVYIIQDYTDPSNWLTVAQYSNWDTVSNAFSITTMDQVYTRANVGDAVTIENPVSVLVKDTVNNGNNTISLTLLHAQEQHDRHYYVKLTDSNGNSFEV